MKLGYNVNKPGIAFYIKQSRHKSHNVLFWNLPKLKWFTPWYHLIDTLSNLQVKHFLETTKATTASISATPISSEAPDKDDQFESCTYEEIPVLECPIELVSGPLALSDVNIDLTSSDLTPQWNKVLNNALMTSVEYGSKSVKITVVADMLPVTSVDEKQRIEVKK